MCVLFVQCVVCVECCKMSESLYQELSECYRKIKRRRLVFAFLLADAR